MAEGDALALKTLEQYRRLCRRRDAWKNLYTLLAKYLLMRRMDFGETSMPSKAIQFSIKDVYDDEASEAARTASQALGGALWPSAAETFELIPDLPANTQLSAEEAAYNSEEINNYARAITKIGREKFDAPESYWMLAWSEHMDDQPIFATSGIFGVEKDSDEQPFCFKSISVERAVIEEGPEGSIDTVFLELALTVRQAVEIYDGKEGQPGCSKKVKEMYAKGMTDEWIKVVHAIKPRLKGKAGEVKKEKPWASIHVEVDTQHTMEEDGFDELPVWITRFRKRPGEMYGRGLGQDALPTIRELNVTRGSFSRALEKILDPPLGVYHEQVGGGGVVNTSAGARVPLYNTGRIPQGAKPIEKLYDIPEPRVANDRLNGLVDRVRSKFLVDRLLDFNNKVRMTLGEAEKRENFRNQALNNIFLRQIIELLNPAIKWGYRVMWRKSMLGLHPEKDAGQIERLRNAGLEPLVVPATIARLMDRGQFPFKIRYISPAARAMQKEQLEGTEKFTNFVLTWSNAGYVDIADNVDLDEAARAYQELSGAPHRLLRSQKEVKKIREGRQQVQASQAQAAQAQVTADTAAKGAKAFRDVAMAGA